jgi:hypothetical protein
LLLSGCHRPNGAIVDRLVIGEVMVCSEFKPNLRALCLPGGRLSGTDNGHQAERFVAAKLRAYGLSNVHFEPFEMPGWQVNRTKVTVVNGPPIVLQKAVALWNTQSTLPDGITAELIDVGDGKQEEFERLGDALRGKFALVRDRGGRRSGKMRLALQRDAAGLIVAGRPGREPVIGTCHPEPRPEPGIVIRHDDGEKLAERLAAGEAVRLNVEVQADVWDARPRNVVGEIPGTGPLAHEIVILCAHLDSWHLAEGATDNGNGSAAILETARALAQMHHQHSWRPRRTVRFVWFMGEEQGLFGSRAYVAAHAGELDDVVAVVNVDMPGAPREFVVFGHPELEKFLRTVASDLAAYELSARVAEPTGPWSDHYPFQDAGVCTLVLRGDLGDGGTHYHTIGDTYDMVDRRKTVQSSAVFAALLRRLADTRERPTTQHPARDELPKDAAHE